MIAPHERIIVALDGDYSLEDVETLAGKLSGSVGMLKVGKRLFTRFGPQVLEVINRKGVPIFLDLKFHDIPNTVAEACAEAVAHKVALINVHASGGRQMMLKACEAIEKRAAELSVPKPKLIAVTVLTSLDDEAIKEIGYSDRVEGQVRRLALLAKDCGLDGVVAAPGEARLIREACGPGFLIVTPGIRPTAVEGDDQKRAVTPKMAMEMGSDYIVVGRPVIKAPDPVAVAKNIAAEMA